MAYQNVGTPRFYINVVEWLKVNNAITLSGSGDWDESIWNTLPVIPSYYDSNILDNATDLSFSSNILTPYSFLAILGHNLRAYNPDYSMYIQSEGLNVETKDVINSFTIGQDQGSLYNGFSIGTFDGAHKGNLHILVVGKVGSMVVGTYYDMPHSPDLKLTMTREMDGVKRIRTKGGADLVNHKYIKPAIWGDAGAWELYEGTPLNQELSRSGRRIWDLSFSYLSDSSIFPETSALSNLGHSDYDVYNWDTNTLLTDDNFYSQVIHKTNGGQLPFIFNPAGGGDNPNNSADMFAICKLDMNSYEFEQVAKNIYNIKLKIREVW